MKTPKLNKNIESILSVTKNVIKKSNEFNEYYKFKDNNLYQSQLPLLMQRSRLKEALYIKNKKKIQDLVLTDEEKGQNKNDEEEKNLITKNPLTQIRKLQVRSKKLPPLCPFYNKKGELLPEVVSTAKALNNLESDLKFNLSGFAKVFPNLNFLTPMNKSKMKNINLYQNIEINFDDFQKEVLFENKYDSLEYNYSDIYNKKDFYKEYINGLIEEISKLTSENELIEEKNKIINNKEIKIEKIFEWGKDKRNILLSLHSLNIKIKEVGSDDIFFEYYLPINLLPLFYYKGYEKFKLFIIALIHWNEESQKFEIDENIYTTINNLLTKCKELKLKFDILDELEPEDEKVIMPNPMPLKKTMSIGKSIYNF